MKHEILKFKKGLFDYYKKNVDGNDGYHIRSSSKENDKKYGVSS